MFVLGRRPALDGIRALAVLGVLLGHAQAVRGQRLGAGGVIGVYVFFVLSGFLITALLVEERRDHGAVSLRRFYVRRALRLLPALLLVLLAVAVAALALPGSNAARTSARAIPAALLYVGNLVAARDGCAALGWLAHTWSLSVEEQFYVAWPVVFVLVARWRRTWLLPAVVAGAVASAAWRAYLWPHPNECRVGHAPDTQADALLVGCALALWLYAASPDARERAARASRLIVLPAVAWLLLVVVWLPGGAAFAYVVGNLVTHLCAAVLVAYVVLNDPPRALTSRVAVAVGRRSYGIYLWHAVLLGLLTTLELGTGLAVAGMVVGTAVAAWLSYALVEEPVLRLKSRYSPVRAGFG